MKTISEKAMASGKRRVTVELDASESIIAVIDGTHYRLGYPLDEVVPSHVVADSVEVGWCPIEQKWKE